MIEVLIVDDSLGVRRSLGDILTGAGYRVRLAEDGMRAVEAVRLEPPALVLMDLRMPGISGIEAMQQILLLQPTTRVLLMTAYAGELSPEQARALGAVDLLLKPFNLEALLGQVKALLSGD